MHFKEQTHVHVLLPHWFDDSVRLGCRNLPAKEYEWPDPGCLRASQQDGVKENERGHHTLTPEKKARLRYSGHMTNEPLPAGHSTNIWDGRRILLSMSLELPPSRRTAIESGIARCGGIIVPYMTNGGEGTKVEETQNVGKCDILVTKWRSGRAYVRAVRENKTIGNKIDVDVEDGSDARVTESAALQLLERLVPTTSRPPPTSEEDIPFIIEQPPDDPIIPQLIYPNGHAQQSMESYTSHFNTISSSKSGISTYFTPSSSLFDTFESAHSLALYSATNLIHIRSCLVTQQHNNLK
jgi:hypothetical protein